MKTKISNKLAKCDKFRQKLQHQMCLMSVIGATRSGSSSSSSSSDNYIEPRECGGLGQATCELSAAKFLMKKTVDKPHSRAFTDPRKGGEWWLCPSNRPVRTLNKVTGSKACRTTNVAKPKSVSAEFLSKVNNSKPDDAFYDIGRAEYWRCPPNFWRNFNKVTDDAACTADLDKHCDSGNIPVGNLSDGYICLKKGECGHLGQRPCLIAEDYPSCGRDKDLAEDFVSNVCIQKKAAACMTMVRTLRLASKAAHTMSEAEKTLNEIVDTARELLFDATPLGSAMDKAGVDFDDLDEIFGSPTGQTDILGQLEEQLDSIGAVIPAIETLHNIAKRHGGELKDYFMSEEFCYATASERNDKLRDIVGADLDFRGERQAGLFDGFPIAKARASGVHLGYFTIGFGITASSGSLIGIDLGITYATDFTKNGNGLFFSFGLNASLAKKGVDGALQIGWLLPPASGEKMEIGDIAGPSLNVSVPTGLSSAISVGFDAGVDISTSDGSLSLGSIGLSFAPGGGDIAADFSVSATTDIELLPVPLRHLRGLD